MAQNEQPQSASGEFPDGGYPMLGLEDVFSIYGPVQGMTELRRRSTLPPRATSEAELAVEIMQGLGQLKPLASVDYVELGH